jgi:hypothetical protein
MSIAKAISAFLHRAKDDAAATEAELKNVLKAIEPEVTALKNAVVDEIKDELPAVVKDVEDAVKGVIASHSPAFTEALTTLHARFDALDAKLADLKAANAAATAAATPPYAAKRAAKKTTAAPAATNAQVSTDAPATEKSS